MKFYKSAPIFSAQAKIAKTAQPVTKCIVYLLPELSDSQVYLIFKVEETLTYCDFRCPPCLPTGRQRNRGCKIGNPATVSNYGQE